MRPSVILPAALLVSIQAACVDEPSRVTGLSGRKMPPISRAMIANGVEALANPNGNTQASDVNAGGYVVGRAAMLSGSTKYSPPVMWTPDGRIIVIDLPGTVPRSGLATAINDAGQVTGYAYQELGNVESGFVWSPTAGAHWLDGIAGYPTASGYAINQRGDVVGSVTNNYIKVQVSHAALWPASGGVIDIGALPGRQIARATGINNTGDVVGYSATNALTSGIDDHAFVWSRTAPMRDLGTLGGRTSYAHAINDRGEVAGYSEDASGNLHAFLWTAGSGMRDLGTLGGSTSIATDINTLGQIAGSSQIPNGKFLAFVWTTDGGMQALADPNPGESNGPVVSGISSTGLVVGNTEWYARYTAFLWHVTFDVQPRASAGGPYAGDEGSSIAFDGSASTGGLDALSYQWDFGDGESAAGAMPTHVYRDNGSYSVRLVITNGNSNDTSWTIATIRNVAPTVELDAIAPTVSGSVVTVRTRFSDPGIRDMPWRYDIDFSVGPRTSGSTAIQSDPIVATSPRYCAEGIYTVTASVTDRDGGTGQASRSVTVSRLAIPIKVLTKTLNPRSKGELTVEVYGMPSFDPTTLDVGTISLGDGASAAVAVSRRPNGEPQSAIADVNGDGRADLVLHFPREQLEATGVLVPPSTRLVLLGRSLDGCQEVRGSEEVRILGKA